MMKPSKVKRFIAWAIDHNKPLLFKSSAGCAKTSLVEQVCKAKGVKLVVSHPVVSQSIDYKGMPWVWQNPETGKPEAMFIEYSDLKILMEATEKTVFFFDDLGQAPPTVQASCMQLLLARKLNDKEVSPHIIFFGATNRKEDKAGVSGILEPVKSRFFSIVQVDVDVQDWVEWAYEEKLPTSLISYVRWRRLDALYKPNPTLDITNSPNPRTVNFAGQMLKDGIDEDLRQEAFEGSCGEGWAREFTAFLNITDLPDIDTILKSPTTAPVPDTKKPDVIYAVAGALIERANKETFKAIVKYAERLPVEFNVCIVKDCILKNKSLGSTTVWQEWIRKYADVLV